MENRKTLVFVSKNDGFERKFCFVRHNLHDLYAIRICNLDNAFRSRSNNEKVSFEFKN